MIALLVGKSEWDEEPHLDLRTAHFYGVLEQALVIWRAASEQNCAHFKEAGLKRKAVVQLDLLLSDWAFMVMQDSTFKLNHLLSTMAELAGGCAVKGVPDGEV